MRRFPVVWVEWVDSVAASGWVADQYAVSHNLACISVGFLVAESEEAITVAASISSAGQIDCPITIPRCAITGLWEVSGL